MAVSRRRNTATDSRHTAMHIHRQTDALRSALADAGRIAFVPTMGNLHAGHIALIEAAREHADCVVASIFVNRLQFAPNEDFDRYPRTFEADSAALSAAGAHQLFAPDEIALYPEPQRYQVVPDPDQADILEGHFRPGFFSGVATVVMKLFQIVRPDVALFGKKDFQQLMVVRNMVRQFAMPIQIIGHATLRDSDGLALSSRNGYLSAEQRAEAPRLHRQLQAVRDELSDGCQDWLGLEARAMAELSKHGWTPQYIAIRRRADLKSPALSDRELVVLGAAFLGGTRLIDNVEVDV